MIENTMKAAMSTTGIDFRIRTPCILGVDVVFPRPMPATWTLPGPVGYSPTTVLK